nr:hypothetical protein [uncultured Caproiciproducens sp.]
MNMEIIIPQDEPVPDYSTFARFRSGRTKEAVKDLVDFRSPSGKVFGDPAKADKEGAVAKRICDSNLHKYFLNWPRKKPEKAL